MYWFPREESTGNRPVWLEYDLAVLELTSMMAEKMLWERCWVGYCQGNLGVIGWNEDSFALGQGGLSL